MVSYDEFAEFILYLRNNPAERAQLRDEVMLYEAVGSAGLARESLQCKHGVYTPERNCPHCGWKVMET